LAGQPKVDQRHAPPGFKLSDPALNRAIGRAGCAGRHFETVTRAAGNGAFANNAEKFGASDWSGLKPHWLNRCLSSVRGSGGEED
jgi:hypothetical protein